MTFAEAIATRARLTAESKRLGAALRAIAGVGSGPMGLTPDHVKQSAEYRAAKTAFDAAFRREREFNRITNQLFKRELAQDRRARKGPK